MFSSFRKSESGNFAIMTALVLPALLLSVGIGIDLTEILRQRHATVYAMEAAGIAMGRQIEQGMEGEELKAFGKQFFESNLGPVDPAQTTLTVLLPNDAGSGGDIKLTTSLDFKPLFLTPALSSMYHNISHFNFEETVKVRTKNTAEIALVLDNSGSMDSTGSGSSKKRMALLKEAATFLVEELAADAKKIKQISKPVQFSVVPFAASVNIGSQYADADWMDKYGDSPVHHENFNWNSLKDAWGDTKKAVKQGNRWIKTGAGWGAEEGQPLTRFTLYNSMKKQIGENVIQAGKYETQRVCKWYYGSQYCYYTSVWVPPVTEPIYGAAEAWKGCVEARPYPYNVNGVLADSSEPESLIVPMFANDETDNGPTGWWHNNWIDDDYTGEPSSYTNIKRHTDMVKYFQPLPGSYASAMDSGPNFSCTTTAITPLQDVTTSAGLKTVKDAIDAMEANGNTNVPEGMAWGWHTLTKSPPFDQGRADSDNNNDKVIIVLTDGANTYTNLPSSYYDPDYIKRSTYAAHGYMGTNYDGGSKPRLYEGLSSSFATGSYSDANYTKAMDEHMEQLCTNAKSEGVTIFSIALDLPSSSSTISELRSCASESRFRKDANGNYEKLFYNATGGELMDVFKAIADELSNLRIVG
ncbi:hypothetical protein CSC94_14905 [Zhengella mangrovi]|uniref:Uncharacterized protein n=2 Tax=Zhengella mangrovi TaxID=1982044 RepID=A0A2G1QL83_9HYPH|nr:hypothetical protein CSC94_14905 [Zhengella mangrovi]